GVSARRGCYLEGVAAAYACLRAFTPIYRSTFSIATVEPATDHKQLAPLRLNRCRIVRLGAFLGRGPGLAFEATKVAFFAAGDKAFGDAFQLLPAGADVTGFLGGDLVIGDGLGDDGQQIGEFLDDLVGGGDEEIGVRMVGLGVLDEKAAGALAD